VNEASRWRIEAARRLSQPYADQPGVQTIVLAGSAAKGLADDWSDLDIVVVWEEPDVAFLDGAPLPSGERFTDLAGDDGSRVEQYFVGALKVDVASMRRAALDELIDDVVVRVDTDPMKQKVAQGFTEGVTLHGPSVHTELRDRLASFPDALVTALVTRHLRLLPLWAPQRMGLDRDDPIAYADMILVDVRAVLSVLAALNRRHWSVTPEAKWNRYLLDHCPLAPRDSERRLRRLLEAPSAAAVDDFATLLDELVTLVEQHAPDVDTRGARRMLELRLDPCPAPPPLP
jgi:predicted nucleotidyltransferase